MFIIPPIKSRDSISNLINKQYTSVKVEPSKKSNARGGEDDQIIEANRMGLNTSRSSR